MSMNDRDRRAVRWGLAILLSLGIVQFLVRPWLADWREVRERIATAQVELAGLEAQVQRVVGQRQRLEDVLGAAVSKPLPTVEEARIRAVKAAEQLLQSAGIQATGVRPQSPRPLRDLQGVTLISTQVEGSGQFMQIPQCLASIQAADQLFIVEKLSISPSPRRPGQMSLSLVLGTLAREENAP